MSVCATLDLFGVHPIAPAASFDVMGLIPVPRGDRARVDCEKKDGSATAGRVQGDGAGRREGKGVRALRLRRSRQKRQDQ